MTRARATGLAAAAAAGFFLGGCMSQAPPPASSGQEMFAFLHQGGGYTRWSSLPEHSVEPPHGPLARVYFNAPAARTIGRNPPIAFPPQAVFVLENRDQSGAIIGLEVMHKRPGFNPRHNGWYWLRYDTLGRVLKEGAMGDCIQCHKRRQLRDYVFSEPPGG